MRGTLQSPSPKRPRARGVRLGALALACLALLAAACGGQGTASGTAPDGTADDTNQSVCEVVDTIDWDTPAVTAADTDDQVVASFEQLEDDEQALVAAATGDLKASAERVHANGERYRERYLSERRAAGSGDALSQRAASAGFSSTRWYVESLVFDDPTVVEDDRRTLSAQLAAACDDLTPPDPAPLSADDAPAGEVLAVRLGAAEIHRFSTTGEDLGALALPSEVEPPIQYLTASPDRRRLAFIAGSAPERIWTIDLDSGATTSATAPTCMDWDDGGVDLWALVDNPPNDFVARIGTDGTFDPGSRLELSGCPYRFDATSLVMSRPAVDGAPLQIDRIPKDGASPENLVSSPCNLVSPRISPDSQQFALTVGCRTGASSGVYLVDTDGQHLEQVVRGVAAAATWSPDGEWLAFGAYSPSSPGDDSQIRVIITTTDGQTMGAVTPPGYSWPIWVAG